MKEAGKRIAASAGKAVTIVLIIMLLPFAKDMFRRFFSDVTGRISNQSRILEQKIEATRRLEVTSIEEEGVLESETQVIILGTVGRTTIRYRYTASVGIDLSKVVLMPDGDRIVFLLPDAEVLNDGIEALQVKRQDLFSKAIDKSTETLLNEQRIKCRKQYLNDSVHTGNIWQNTVNAFEETLRGWLSPYGETQYSFEIRKLNGEAETHQ